MVAREEDLADLAASRAESVHDFVLLFGESLVGLSLHLESHIAVLVGVKD